ncbi:MAG: lytic transglycosylase domain-containing protein [Pseudomonadota bacterium]
MALARARPAGLSGTPATAAPAVWPGPDDGLRAVPAGIAPARAPAAPQRNPKTLAAYAKGARICKLIKAAATEHGLDPAYFARLIWKESRFDAKALSPKGAQGIAQFMPGTAKLVGLKDPWDPAQAIPASASHLRDLRNALGNWGLAAAAYNAGAGRVDRWLRGRAGLPGETRDYVYSITGEPAEFFRKRAASLPDRPLAKNTSFDAACAALPIIRTRSVFGTPRLPWGAQIAGNVSKSRAAAQMNRVKRRYARAIGGAQMQLVPKRGPRGTRALWSGQAGAKSRREAARLCRKIKVAGGACIVRKN